MKFQYGCHLVLGLAAKQVQFSPALGLLFLFSHSRQQEKKKFAFTSLSSSIYKDVGMVIKCNTNDKNNPSRQDKHCRIIR